MFLLFLAMRLKSSLVVPKLPVTVFQKIYAGMTYQRAIYAIMWSQVVGNMVYLRPTCTLVLVKLFILKSLDKNRNVLY